MRGHIRKKGTSWQACVKATDPATGKARQLTATRKTKTEAEAALVRLLAQAGRADAAGSNATVAELLTAWQDVRSTRWSPSTIRNTRELADRWLVPRFGRTLVRKLRTADIDIFYADLVRGTADRKAISASSVRRIHTVLRSALGQAVKWEWILDNPAARCTLPHGETHEIVPPEPGDVVRLVEAAMVDDPDYGAWLHMAAATGARRGEVCALRWRDVDLDEGAVRIARAISLGDELVEKETKTRSRRRIQLDTATVDVLRAHRRRCAERALACGLPLEPDAYIWSLEVDGSAPWRPDLATHRWVRLRRRLGLEHVRLHDLRHFHASVLLDANISVTTVAGRLGHAGGGRTTMTVYGHMLQPADQRAADLVAETLKRARA
jgi:integrase